MEEKNTLEEDKNLVRSLSAYILEVNEMSKNFSMMQRNYIKVLSEIKSLEQQLGTTTQNLMGLIDALQEKMKNFEEKLPQ